MPEEALPGVTVVVPTLNRGTYLLDTVRDLLAQNYRPLEILIVDQSDVASPELADLVAAHPDIISHQPVSFRGLPIARNYGWQMARNDLIVYVDDDIRCGPDLVAEHQRALVHPSVGLVAGGIDEAHTQERKPLGTGTYDRWRAVADRGFNAHGTLDVEHVPGGNFGVRREVMLWSGGVDERLNFGSALYEETDLALRAIRLGWRARFNGSARLTHLAASGGGTRQPDYCRYVFALAHNRSIMIRRHSQWYQWPTGLAWSGKLIGAYTLHSRDVRVGLAGIRGSIHGWRAGGKPPRCTSFVTDRSA